MRKTAYTLMAMVLVTATVITAAAAFAGVKKKVPANAVSSSVASTNTQISQAMLRLKLQRKIAIRQTPPPGGNLILPRLR